MSSRNADRNFGPQSSHFGNGNDQSKTNKIFLYHFKLDTTFAINLATNAHSTNDQSSLINYCEFGKPKEIKFNVSGELIVAKAVSMGKLPTYPIN